MRHSILVAAVTILNATLVQSLHAETVALWLFDEQAGLYPSSVLGDAATNECPLVLGRGGRIVEGKFGGALAALEQEAFELSPENRFIGFKRRPSFDASRKSAPMDWSNAYFCALMTRGERHLRQEVDFTSATRTPLNLGDFDWTVEFWYLPTEGDGNDGVLFEIGQGPRGESDQVTMLVLDADRKGFTLVNRPSETVLAISTEAAAISDTSSEWRHLAFVYEAASSQLRHYVDGKLQRLPEKCQLKPLRHGDEDYLSVGRDGNWERPFPGRIDELRISDACVYRDEFEPPESFSKYHRDYVPPELKAGPPLLFAGDKDSRDVVPLGGRKYLFIDDAIYAEHEQVKLTVNPPRLAERVNAETSTHLSVQDGDDGLIRLYYKTKGDRLAVQTSRDGVHFESPDLGPSSIGLRNVVVDDPVGMGTVFVDPNAPPEERIKYLSGRGSRGIYVYTSSDGYYFTRNETAAFPFRAASQSIVYYDEQQQKYVAFHRTDMPETVGGKTSRAFVRTETTDAMRPWPFEPLSLEGHFDIAKRRRIGTKLPWYLDNGPLTPGGFGVEYPIAFEGDEELDPVGTDVYVPKNVKYEWATDTYFAFPLMYLHYHGDGPSGRQELGRRDRKRGSGPLETQIAVSRDGVHWKRYPRPAYIGIGRHDGYDIHKNYIAHGMVRRGEEIWQYYLGSEQYHSSWDRKGREAVFRVVQRVDGFISADTPYAGGTLTTRPLVFEGNRLVLNIDTDATGYCQIGILDADGRPIDDYEVDDCVYINGDHIEIEVEWMDRGSDLSRLAGKPVQLVFQSRGTKLYSMQFVTR